MPLVHDESVSHTFASNLVHTANSRNMCEKTTTNLISFHFLYGTVANRWRVARKSLIQARGGGLTCLAPGILASTEKCKCRSIHGWKGFKVALVSKL